LMLKSESGIDLFFSASATGHISFPHIQWNSVNYCLLH
jgi:hypothetical protein